MVWWVYLSVMVADVNTRADEPRCTETAFEQIGNQTRCVLNRRAAERRRWGAFETPCTCIHWQAICTSSRSRVNKRRGTVSYILAVGLFNSDPLGLFWPLASSLSLSLCGRKIGGRGWKDREDKNRSHYSIITAYGLLLGNGIRLTLIIILSHFFSHSSAENRK